MDNDGLKKSKFLKKDSNYLMFCMKIFTFYTCFSSLEILANYKSVIILSEFGGQIIPTKLSSLAIYSI